jgi:hypothetical protein
MTMLGICTSDTAVVAAVTRDWAKSLLVWAFCSSTAESRNLMYVITWIRIHYLTTFPLSHVDDFHLVTHNTFLTKIQKVKHEFKKYKTSHILTKQIFSRRQSVASCSYTRVQRPNANTNPNGNSACIYLVAYTEVQTLFGVINYLSQCFL